MQQLGTAGTSLCLLLLLLSSTACLGSRSPLSIQSPGSSNPSFQVHSTTQGLVDSNSNSKEVEFAEAYEEDLDALPRLLLEDETAASGVGEAVSPGAYALEDTVPLNNDLSEEVDDDIISSNAPITYDTTTVAEPTARTASLEAATSQIAVTTTRAAPTDQAPGNQIAEQLSGGQIAGIVLGVAVAAGVAVMGAMAYNKHRRRRREDYIGRYREIELH